MNTRHCELRWRRVALFALCFAVVFGACQQVLTQKHSRGQYLPGRYETYASLPPDTVDVVFFGSSVFDHAISPNVLWNEAGIASYNMSATIHYYTFAEQKLRTALELNTKPKYAVFVPAKLYRSDPYNTETLAAYRKLINSQPTLKQKVRAMLAYWRDLDEQQADWGRLELMFPLVAFHTRWERLTQEDFLPDRVYAAQDPAYMLGQTAVLEVADVTERARQPITLQANQLNRWGAKGWARIFKLCHEQDITPVVVRMPQFEHRVSRSQMRQANAFYQRCGVIVFDYALKRELERMDWDYTRDFSDANHLNFYGGAKLSADLAKRLLQLPGMEDHRGDERYAAWDTYCDTYYTTYQDLLARALGEERAQRNEL